jgi:hypothetical protein
VGREEAYCFKSGLLTDLILNLEIRKFFFLVQAVPPTLFAEQAVAVGKYR